MPIKVNLRALGSHAASLAWVAVRSFVGTLLTLTLAGLILAGLSYYFLRDYPWIYGVIAVVIALVESVVTGVVFGAKRAIALTLAHGLASLRLGKACVGLIFDRMLGVADGTDLGERGGRITRGLERLPLAQAEALLSGAVRDVTGDIQQSGWLRRKMQARLLEMVRKYTAARFRQEGASHGGIDLLKAREELERTLDDALVKKVRAGLRLWTALAIIGLPVVVAVQTLVLYMLLRSHG